MEKHIAKFYEEVKKDLAGSDEEKVRRALRLCFAVVMVEERDWAAKIAAIGNPDCTCCAADPQGCACPDTAKLIAAKIQNGRP